MESQRRRPLPLTVCEHRHGGGAAGVHHQGTAGLRRCRRRPRGSGRNRGKQDRQLSGDGRKDARRARPGCSESGRVATSSSRPRAGCIRSTPSARARPASVAQTKPASSAPASRRASARDAPRRPAPMRAKRMCARVGRSDRPEGREAEGLLRVGAVAMEDPACSSSACRYQTWLGYRSGRRGPGIRPGLGSASKSKRSVGRRSAYTVRTRRG